MKTKKEKVESTPMEFAEPERDDAAEDAEAEAERHALNLLNFDWSGE